MESFDHNNADLKNAPTHETVQTAKPSAVKGKRHRHDIKEADKSRIPTLDWDRETEHKTTYAPLLTVAEKIEPKAWLDSLKNRPDKEDLFAAFDGFQEPELAHFEWYEHTGQWHNRLIHADAKRAMASLLEHEHMAGSVQCVYFDPPYGMDFDAKFMNDALQVAAFRDTYENGIHTYLSGLRETLMLARELLAEPGSLFMQIGDVNVHRVALVLDEVFGPENRVSTITFKTTGGGSSKKGISKSADYILWYAKDRESMYFQGLYEKQSAKEWCDTQTFAGGGDFPDGISRALRPEERNDPDRNLPKGTDLWSMGGLTSQGPSDGEQGKPFEYNNIQFGPGGLTTRQWSVDHKGLQYLAKSGRLWTNVKDGEKEANAGQLRLKIYRSEMPGRRVTNLWDRTIAATKKHYPVQTGDLAIQRCILMTTEPGDLVLDPTNGSGTTATVAETWGRRWIAIDSSRESLAVTRERVLMQNYPAHLLIGSEEGFKKEQEIRKKVGVPPLPKRPAGRGNDPSTGIVVERLPYLSAATLAYTDRPRKSSFHDHYKFVDRPLGSTTGRVCGRFTVESEYIEDMVSPDEVRRPSQQKRDTDWEERVKSALLAGGLQSESGTKFAVDELRSIIDDEDDQQTFESAQSNLRWDASIRDIISGKHIDADIAIQPHDSIVRVSALNRMVKAVINRGKSTLIVIGIEFGPGTESLTRNSAVNVIRVNASADLHLKGVQDRKQGTGPARLFVVSELATDIQKVDSDNFTLTLNGLNEFNPVKGDVNFRPTKDIRLWMLDIDYDGLQFHACRIHLTDVARKPKNRKLLQTILRNDSIDAERIKAVFGYVSHPFPMPKNGQVAVRAILAGGGVATTSVPVVKGE